MNSRQLMTILLPALLPAAVYAQGASVMELTAGMHRIEAEVVYTQESRQRGLMMRPAMPMHHGMLFVFPDHARHCMWMKNTLLPLSVAFIDEDGRIINVEEMQPQTEDNHCAARPARFALEMNAGWFKKRALGSGTALAGIERAPAPR